MRSALKRLFRPKESKRDLYKITIARLMGSDYVQQQTPDQIEDDCHRVFTAVWSLVTEYAKKPEHLTVSFTEGMIVTDCRIRIDNGAKAVVLTDRLRADLDDMTSTNNPRISLKNLTRDQRWAELNAPERN